MSVPAEYFQNLYREKADPWNFGTGPYEDERYRATLAALPREHYANVLETPRFSAATYRFDVFERYDD